MALYPYTLQPISLNLTDQEFRQAQTQLFNASNQNLAKITPKIWGILSAICILAVLGLVYVKGYSTIIFWLMLIGVVIFLLVRTIGLKWYVKQEFQKQLASQTIPKEMQQMKIGIQQHGLIISLPASANQLPKMPKGFHQPQMRGTLQQQAVIKWENIKNWQETDDYIFMLFEIQGQQGSQIVPKRLAQQKFPLDSLRHHLQESVGRQGFDLTNKSTDQYFPNF